MVENHKLDDVILGCKDGDNDSFSQLIDMYSGRCYGYFYRLTGDKETSDELLSELFVRLVEKISTFKGGAFDGWLFRVARNLFYDHLRAKQHRKRLVEEKKKRLEEESQGDGQRLHDRIDELQKHLDSLDEETRELIMLRFYSKMSFKKIAALRSEPIGTTLSKVHRGFKKLRELME